MYIKIFMKIIISLLLIINSSRSFTFDYFSSELVVLALSPQNFSFSLSSDILYHPSLNGLPDLPSWLNYAYSSSSKLGFIYGSPPEGEKDVKIEVIAIEKSKYNTSRRVINLNINYEKRKLYEIDFKVNNYDISDMLSDGRLNKLSSIITQNLWPDSYYYGGRFTAIVPASTRGDRLPLSPHDKEGVYVTYGSNLPFSDTLSELEKEVEQLRKKWGEKPCPKYFKRTSFERFFRKEFYAIDWCSFKLLRNDDAQKATNELDETNFLGRQEEEPAIRLLRKSEVVKRSYILDVIYTLLVPLLVMMVLLAFLTLAMCCHRSNMMPNISEIQMVQYMNKGSLTPKFRKARQNSPHPSMTTNASHMDTLPRSGTQSATSTLNRQTPSRRFEDYETLNRPDPPPYQRQV